jgi:hypothetical protein
MKEDPFIFWKWIFEPQELAPTSTSEVEHCIEYLRIRCRQSFYLCTTSANTMNTRCLLQNPNNGPGILLTQISTIFFQMKQPKDKTLPKFFSKMPVCDCIGFGIIRGIDPVEKVFYILTPVTRNELHVVNTVIKGAITIPSQLLVKLVSSTFHITYSEYLMVVSLFFKTLITSLGCSF